MNTHFKTLVIGILLGVCVMLSMGQRRAEPAQKADADYRYQITAVSAQNNSGYVLFILDHEKQKIYSREWNGAQGGTDVKALMGN